jgi:integrase
MRLTSGQPTRSEARRQGWFYAVGVGIKQKLVNLFLFFLAAAHAHAPNWPLETPGRLSTHHCSKSLVVRAQSPVFLARMGGRYPSSRGFWTAVAESQKTIFRFNAWAAIRKRAKEPGFLTPVGCHTWRATGITIYLENDGRLEHAQQMAGHEPPRTTKLYDRTKDEITLSEVERIRL